MRSSNNDLIRSPDYSRSRNHHSNTSPEFTPIGSKSGNGFIESVYSPTNLSPIINFSDKYTDRLEKIRNNNDMKSNGIHDSQKNTNSNNHTLHRVNGSRSYKSAYNRADDSVLNSSSVASSVWEDDINEKPGFIPETTRHSRMSKLFGRDGISKGTQIIPDFVTDSQDDNRDINIDSNMLRFQSDLVKKLQSQNTNLKVEVLTLRQNLTKLPTDKIELIEQNVALNQEIIKLKEIIDASSNDVDADEKIKLLREQYEADIDRLRVDNQYLTDDNEVLKDGKQELTHEVENLEQKCSHYEAEIAELKSELNEVREDRDDRDYSARRISELEEENAELERHIDGLTRDNKDLSNEVERLESELEEANRNAAYSGHGLDNEKVHDRVVDEADLNDQLQKLEEENAMLKKKYDEEKRLTYKVSREKVEEMTKSLEEASKTVDSLERELEAKESETISLTKNIKELNLQLQSYQRKNESLESRVERLKGNQSEATKLLTDEVTDLYAKIDHYEEQIEQLQQTIESYRNKEDDYEETYVRDLEDDKNKLYQSLVESQKLIQKKDDEITNLKLDISTLTMHKNDIHASANDRNDETVTIDELLQLKEKFEQERENNQHKLDNLTADHKEITDNLLARIDELEESKSKLIQDFEDIQIQYRELEAQYNNLINSREVEDLGDDLAKVTLEYKNSQDEYILLSEKYSQLQELIREKDLELYNVRQSLDNQVSVNTSGLDEKLGLLEQNITLLKTEKEKLENERRTLDDENFQLKNSLERLNKKLKSNEEILAHLKDSETENSSLKSELSMKKLEILRLEKKLNSLDEEKKNLESVINSVSAEQDKILLRSDRISEKIKTKGLENGFKLKDFERQLEEKNKQYNDIVKEYNYMKNDLIERLKEMKKEIKNQGNDSKEEIAKWKTKYEQSSSKLKVSERHLQALRNEIKSLNEELEHERERASIERNDRMEWFPPTPESPSRIENHNRLDILKAQKDLLMLKVKEKSEKISDLKYMLKYLQLELELKNEMFEKNKNLFLNAGIREKPIGEKKGGLTFRVVALTILAGVRFRNRLKELQNRKLAEKELKREIEAGRHL